LLVSFCVALVSFAFLFIVNVYVFFVVPSSAVTTILNVFAPSFNVFLPVPDIVCLLWPFLAYISTVSTSFGTSVLYDNLFDEKPLKSFGVIPKFDNVATFEDVLNYLKSKGVEE